MTTSLSIERAAENDLWLDDFGDPYCAILAAGDYVIADPAIILSESDYEAWHHAAAITEQPFPQYGSGWDGAIHSARINDYPVSGFTVYGFSNIFKDEDGKTYESSASKSGHPILAVFPVALLDELGAQYSPDQIFTISEENVEQERNDVYYSNRTHRMFVGGGMIAIYTGQLDGASDEIRAEQVRDGYTSMLGYLLSEG